MDVTPANKDNLCYEAHGVISSIRRLILKRRTTEVMTFIILPMILEEIENNVKDMIFIGMICTGKFLKERKESQ